MTTDLLREDIPPPWLLGTVQGIDRYVGRGSGLLFCWLIIPMVASLTYEVFARYLFHAPTIWAYDTTYMLYGSHFMLGAAYCLLRGGHIRTDISTASGPNGRRAASMPRSTCCCSSPACSSSWCGAGTRPTTPGISASAPT